MTPTTRILSLEDSPDDFQLVQRELRAHFGELDILRIETPEALAEALKLPWDAIISDWSMPRLSAVEALSAVKKLGLDIPFIIVSGTIGEETAVAALRAGARDFLAKDKLTRLTTAVVREIRECEDRKVRRQAESALRSSEARFRRFIETTTEGVWTVDAMGTVSFVNRRMAVMLGLPESAILGCNFIDFVDEPERATLARSIGAWSTQVGAHQAEMRFRRSDGTALWGLVESTPIRAEGGEREGALVMVMDLTERKRTEEALRKSEEQFLHAQKMEAVGRLAGGVAHDFNNLLSVILTYSEMGIGRLDPGDAMREELQEIHKAGERAAALTKQLLAFSRKQVLQPRTFNINDVIGGAMKMLARLIGEDISVSTTLANDLGSVRADPGQFEQALMNLVVNARDAMPTGGVLTIETANADLSDAYAQTHSGVTAGSYVLLAVSDNGCGMDKETQTRIFEPFFTTKEVGKGTGLGLSMVFAIVQQSAGHIWVYSEPGKGTTFKIYLPRVDAPPAVSDAGPKAQVSLRGTETILLAEDDTQIRSMVARYLRNLGYLVLEATNGQQALDVAERHPHRIDLLLTDVVMPILGGAELAKQLRAVRTELKILCMSGYTDQVTLNHGILAANLPYIEKPITPDRLARKIKDVLSS